MKTLALERQIHTHYYERLLASQDKEGVTAEANEKIQSMGSSPKDFIKDPYILDFLGIKSHHTLNLN